MRAALVPFFTYRTSTTVGGWIRRTMRRLWRAYWDRRERQVTALILRSLDCRTLHDIGIDRSEIDSLIYGRPSDRRHTYETDWHRRRAS